MMKKEKLAYTAPTTDILELRVENAVLNASLRGNEIDPAYLDEWEEEL